MSSSSPPVSSHNEWDPLEEVIVGRLDHAAVPPWHVVERARGLQGLAAVALRALAGRPYPWLLRANAQRELAWFVRLLEREGITVRRPEAMEHTRVARTPFWSSSGFCTASPRDLLLVVGDELIEAPSPWRARYFEGYAYRSLLKDYFARGARWSAAPKPQLADALYDHGYRAPRRGDPARCVITEWEPVFDAADFARCGRDLFVTLGNATNRAGVAWLRRHLGEDYAIHEIPSACPTPMHIDTTFIPLRPGFAMLNPAFADKARLPAALRGWQLVDGPPPDPIPGLSGAYLSLVSAWIHLNILSLDPRRVVVERSQVTLQRALRGWGFEPIPCDFMHYRVFGGGFHCATVDVRRRGVLERYH